MTANAPVLKHRPSDFLVREVLVPRTCTPEEAAYDYFSLAKSGYTTMEAVRMIAAAFGLPSEQVTYGGLKDEDGITEQLIALPAGTERAATWEHLEGTSFLRLVRYGYGIDPLRIGGLEGNAFRIVARDVDPEFAERTCASHSISLLFLNYYDIQRFGVPGGVRRTHFVGRAILENDWEIALTELIGLGAPESAAAARWSGDPRSFFTQLDPRVPGFYLSAHGSHEWNQRLRAQARERATRSFDIEVEGVPFTYVSTSNDAVEVMAASSRLAYRRYGFVDGEVTWRESSRASVIQAQVAFDGWRPDEAHEGRAAVELRFFLPSGCYATAALRQLFALRTIFSEVVPA